MGNSRKDFEAEECMLNDVMDELRELKIVSHDEIGDAVYKIGDGIIALERTLKVAIAELTEGDDVPVGLTAQLNLLEALKAAEGAMTLKGLM